MNNIAPRVLTTIRGHQVSISAYTDAIMDAVNRWVTCIGSDLVLSGTTNMLSLSSQTAYVMGIQYNAIATNVNPGIIHVWFDPDVGSDIDLAYLTCEVDHPINGFIPFVPPQRFNVDGTFKCQLTNDTADGQVLLMGQVV